MHDAVQPMKLLSHCFRRNSEDVIGRQWYLDPYPGSLGFMGAT